MVTLCCAGGVTLPIQTWTTTVMEVIGPGTVTETISEKPFTSQHSWLPRPSHTHTHLCAAVAAIVTQKAINKNVLVPFPLNRPRYHLLTNGLVPSVTADFSLLRDQFSKSACCHLGHCSVAHAVSPGLWPVHTGKGYWPQLNKEINLINNRIEACLLWKEPMWSKQNNTASWGKATRMLKGRFVKYEKNKESM